MVNATPRLLYPRERKSVAIVEETEWASGPGLEVGRKSHPAGIRSPDFPARSESLYRLSYPGPCTNCIQQETIISKKYKITIPLFTTRSDVIASISAAWRRNASRAGEFATVNGATGKGDRKCTTENSLTGCS